MAGERTAALQDNLYELGELALMFVFDFCQVRLESQGENIFAYNDRKQTAITISVRPANTRQTGMRTHISVNKKAFQFLHPLL